MRQPVLVRRWAVALGKLMLLVGALSVTYGLFAFAGLQLALRTREVSVPNVRGLTAPEAQVVLADAESRDTGRATTPDSPDN